MRLKDPVVGVTALFVASLSIRILFCAESTGLGVSPPNDYREYVTTADRLLKHGTIVSPLIPDDATKDPSDLMPPAYAFYVAGVYSLFGVESFTATLLLQITNALATSIIVPIVFATARRLFGQKVAWIAAVMACVSPLLIRYTGFVWDTALFSLGVALVVWQAARLAGQSNPWHRWFLFGLALGVLALLNPALTITYPLLVLWPATASRSRPSHTWLKPVALTTLGWLIVVTPWSLRNLNNVGSFSYVRGGFMLELWRGFCPEAEQGTAAAFESAFPLKNAQAQQRIVELGEPDYIAECGQQALAAIRDDPIRATRLIARRFIDYWFAQLATDIKHGKLLRRESLLDAAAKLIVIFESALLLLMFWPKRRTHDTLWLLGIVVAFSLVYILTNVQMRFRAPCEPLMAILAAATLVNHQRPSSHSAVCSNGSDTR